MPWIVHPGSEDASGICRSRHSYARAHVVEVPRVFKQDYRTRRRLENEGSHVDLGTLGDTHDPGPRCVRSEDRKNLRWDDLELRTELILYFWRENHG
jgi:hypothetical protein